MRRFGIILAVLVIGLCLAQTTGTVTITVPADVATALAHAHAAQYAEIKNGAAKFFQPLTEDNAPSTVQGMLQAEIATAIADKVQRYAPADLPSRQSGESDVSQRNRYQSQIRAKITVR